MASQKPPFLARPASYTYDSGEVATLPLAQRSRAFEWRRQWFNLSRSDDETLLATLRDAAYRHKRDLIDKAAPSNMLAGYAPAGAGSPWYSIGPRNVNGRVKSIAVHPTNPDIIYAGAAAGGVWKSTDGGQTWDALFDMQESLAIGAIGVAASNPQTVYAGSGEWTPGFPGSYPGAGVYVSTDGGATWSLRNACLSRRIGKVVVDPTNAQRVWICGNAGLERTNDGGVTWTRLRADFVTDVVLDPTNSSTVFVAVRNAGMFKSTNHGTTFTALAGSPTGAGIVFPQIAVGHTGAHGSSFLVFKDSGTVSTSIDGGTTFTTVSTGHQGYFGWCDAIACAPDDETIVFCGGIPLERSTDGGATWSPLSVHADQHAVVFAPSNANIVYFANDGGVWRSDDKGATVRKVSNGLVITQFYNIGFWPTLSNVVGGGSQDNAVAYTTSGLTWNPVFHSSDGGWFVIDPADPRTMYAEGQGGDVAKTVDGGTTWTSVTAGLTGLATWEGILTMDPNDHLRLYYGMNVVLRTLDGCATAWTTVSQALNGFVSAIAVAPSDSTRVYVATTTGHVYRSDDGGNTLPWASISAGVAARPVSAICVDASDKNHVLVSLGGVLTTGVVGGAGAAQSVYQSLDGGATWTDVSGDLPNITGNAVVGDPNDASTFYVATDGGVYRTTNAGVNWTPFDNGIPNVPVSDLTVDPVKNMLYAGTFGRGAYRLDIAPAANTPSVDLYMRDDDLDAGLFFPSPSALPDPLQPAPVVANWWTSPDIKFNHVPYYAPAGTVFDGVDFDTALVHQDPVRGATNRVYLQVHNRGWMETTNVSVRAFVADAGAGLPPLPNALVPPAFDLSTSSPWTPVGPATLIPVLEPNRPVVVTWDVAFPLTTATHTCCLAVVSSPDDPFVNQNTDIYSLVSGDKRACLKNLHVVGGPLPPERLRIVAMDFHNPRRHSIHADVVIRPTLFERGTIALLLPEIEVRAPLDKYAAVRRIPLVPNDPIGTWDAPGNTLRDERLLERWNGLDRRHLWEFSSTQVSRLEGITLQPGQTLRGALVISHKRDVATPAAPRVTIEQWVDGQLIGGSTFQIGYDTGSRPTPQQIRRVQILAERASRIAGREQFALWARTTIANDPTRASLRLLGKSERGIVVYDGYLADGESLTIELLRSHGPENDGAPNLLLFRHRFVGPIDPWLGTHALSEQANGLISRLTVREITSRPIDVAD